MRARMAVVVALLAAFAGCGGDDSNSASKDEAKSPEERRKTLAGLDEKQVAKRVEQLREANYAALPKFKIVTREQSASYIAKQAGSSGNVKEDEEVLKLLGELPPDLSAKELGGTVGGEAVLGYYNGRPPQVAMVAGPTADDPKVAEAALAHELAHGLDDQRFDIFEKAKRMTGGPADRGSAYAALVEGDASVVENTYAEEYDATAGGAGAADSGSEEPSEVAKKLPFALIIQVGFTYQAGAKFVEGLVEKGKGYDLVDQAFEQRPPISSAQILHPEQYIENVTPEGVSLSPGRVLGDGWNGLDSTTFGELEVLQLLAMEEDQLEDANTAAEGWTGGALQFWRKGKFEPKACAAPCYAKDAVVIGLRWSGADDAKEFEDTLGSSLEENQDAKPAGDGAFSVKDGAVAIESTARATTVAWAPTPELAKRLAQRAG